MRAPRLPVATGALIACSVLVACGGGWGADPSTPDRSEPPQGRDCARFGVESLELPAVQRRGSVQRLAATALLPLANLCDTAVALPELRLEVDEDIPGEFHIDALPSRMDSAGAHVNVAWAPPWEDLSQTTVRLLDADDSVIDEASITVESGWVELTPVDAHALHFGRVPQGCSRTLPAQVENTGFGPIEITAVTVSDPGSATRVTAALPPGTSLPMQLLSGERLTANVTFTPPPDDSWDARYVRFHSVFSDAGDIYPTSLRVFGSRGADSHRDWILLELEPGQTEARLAVPFPPDVETIRLTVDDEPWTDWSFDADALELVIHGLQAERPSVYVFFMQGCWD